MKLYGYWRSGTSYRVRIALALKGVAVEHVAVDLLSGAHHGDAYRSLNPQGLVPALQLDDGTLLTQSPAIIEFLDETQPGPKLLPDDPAERARARQMAALIGCDIHPLQNLRVLRFLQNAYGHDKTSTANWAAHWIAEGFGALEQMLAADAMWNGPYLMGTAPGVADCYLLPQLYGARRHGLDLEPFVRLLRVETALLNIPALAAAHPDHQPDALSS